MGGFVFSSSLKRAALTLARRCKAERRDVESLKYCASYDGYSVFIAVKAGRDTKWNLVVWNSNPIIEGR